MNFGINFVSLQSNIDVFRPNTDVEGAKRFQVSDGLGNLEYFDKGGFLLKNQIEFISSPNSIKRSGLQPQETPNLAMEYQ